MEIRPAFISALLALSLMVAAPGVAFANGAGFFEDEEEPHGTPYYGFVKNEQGRGIAGAVVLLRVKGQPTEYKSQTNTLGFYRSTDIPREADPKSVEVTAAKAGFQELRRMNRNPLVKSGMPNQIDFVLKVQAQ